MSAAAQNDFLVVLTGAGISAESGVPTFRANGGLWRNYRFQDLATPEAFQRNPEVVWEFYRWRQEGVLKALPNRGHDILSEMEATLGSRRFFLITQNVDNLHERAGSQDVLHMHGEITKARCIYCHTVLPQFDYQLGSSSCPQCRRSRSLRPHIVWFGERPFFLEEIDHALERATLFISIGTSGTVYPASQFVHTAKQNGALTLLLNLDPPENGHAFDLSRQGQASTLLEELWRQGKKNIFEYVRKMSP